MDQRAFGPFSQTPPLFLTSHFKAPLTSVLSPQGGEEVMRITE